MQKFYITSYLSRKAQASFSHGRFSFALDETYGNRINEKEKEHTILEASQKTLTYMAVNHQKQISHLSLLHVKYFFLNF